MILTKSSQGLPTLLVHSATFSNGILFSNCFYMRTWPSRNHVIITPKWGVPNGNHMNDNVVEVNGLATSTLPGSLLHEKEPGCEATAGME